MACCTYIRLLLFSSLVHYIYTLEHWGVGKERTTKSSLRSGPWCGRGVNSKKRDNVIEGPWEAVGGDVTQEKTVTCQSTCITATTISWKNGTEIGKWDGLHRSCPKAMADMFFIFADSVLTFRPCRQLSAPRSTLTTLTIRMALFRVRSGPRLRLDQSWVL